MRINPIILMISLSFFIVVPLFAQDSLWIPTKGPYGGEISSVVMNEQYVFAGAPTGGVYRSSDEGEHWIESGLNGLNVTSLAFGPGNRLYAGTLTIGVFVSTDYGESWALLPMNYNGPLVGSLSVSGNGNIFANLGGSGGYRSTDEGHTWAPMYPIPFPRVGTNGYLFAGAFGGIHRSSDNGETWSFRTGGIPGTATIYVCAADSLGRVFASASGGRIYRSFDNGDTWIEVVNQPNTLITALSVNDEGSIFYGARNQSTGRIEIRRSTNGGQNWRTLENGLTLSSPSVNAIAAKHGGRIFLGTQDGVFKSTNNGDVWSRVNAGIAHIPVRCLAVNSLNHIFAGTSFGGIYRSVGHGTYWTHLTTGLKDAGVLSLAVNGNDWIFAGTDGYGVFRSSDNGESWTQINSGLGNDPSIHVDAIVIDSENRIFLSSIEGITVSRDNGETWLSTGLTAYGIYSLVIDFRDWVYASAPAGKVYLSTDHGVSWVQRTVGYQGSYVSSVAVNQNGDVYALQEYWGVYRSTDAGNTWVNIAPWHSQIRSLAVAKGGDIFVSSRVYGVLRSQDNGQTWLPFRTGLPNALVEAFAIDQEGQIYAAVGSWSIYKSYRSTVNVDGGEEPTVPVLLQNFPNPFNPSTKIVYAVKSREPVNLKVFDVLGREVATLVDGIEEAGGHEVVWNGTDDGGLPVSSGLYFYRVNIGERTVTKKMMMVR